MLSTFSVCFRSLIEGRQMSLRPSEKGRMATLAEAIDAPVHTGEPAIDIPKQDRWSVCNGTFEGPGPFRSVR